MSNENEKFDKRVYGVMIVRANLANYNADFTGSPRVLPSGEIYATDKVVKFKIRDYLAKNGENIFVKTRYKNDCNPMNLDEVYKNFFPDDNNNKLIVLRNLLSMIDIRLFGITYAGNTNLSIHGPVQIAYGINRYKDATVFTDQIGSPYLNLNKSGGDQTTLGSQTRSEEVHYVHHFSVNPNNLSFFVKQIRDNIINGLVVEEKQQKNKKGSNNKKLDKNIINKRLQILKESTVKDELCTKIKEIGDDKINDWKQFVQDKCDEIMKVVEFNLLTSKDIEKLKKAMYCAVTAYDSTSKKGAENEFLLWVEMKDNEKVLRDFTELIEIEKNGDKTKIKLKEVIEYLNRNSDSIEKIEYYCDDSFVELDPNLNADNVTEIEIERITVSGSGDEE